MYLTTSEHKAAHLSKDIIKVKAGTRSLQREKLTKDSYSGYTKQFGTLTRMAKNQSTKFKQMNKGCD